MTKVISISNPKGGVGKTTTAINLAASLCIAEKKVLIIDMDTNGAVSIGLGLESDEINAGVMEIFLGARELPETIHVTPIPGLDIIPCNVRTLEQENRMNTITKNRKLLSRKMQDAVAKDKIHYDYIIIDTPPALNDITMSALYASDSVVIPLQCGYFSLNIIHRLLELIHRIRSSANPELAVEGILLNFYEKTTRTSQRTIEEARRLFKNQLFKTVIPKNAAISFASFEKKPAAFVDALSTGAVAYLNLAKEIITNDKLRQRQFRKMPYPPMVILHDEPFTGQYLQSEN